MNALNTQGVALGGWLLALQAVPYGWRLSQPFSTLLNRATGASQL